MPLKWTYKYVEGHQDKNDQTYHLDEWANLNILNIEMDINTKSHFYIAKE
jgi:hypothetical protein